MIRLHGVKARVARLDELTRALTKAIVIIGESEDPLVYLERQRYLDALHRAVGGLDEARVALVEAVMRMEESEADFYSPSDRASGEGPSPRLHG